MIIDRMKPIVDFAWIITRSTAKNRVVTKNTTIEYPSHILHLCFYPFTDHTGSVGKSHV